MLLHCTRFCKQFAERFFRKILLTLDGKHDGAEVDPGFVSRLLTAFAGVVAVSDAANPAQLPNASASERKSIAKLV